ncbi:MAG: VacJ family lipoprotein [Rickettsiales bacterium]
MIFLKDNIVNFKSSLLAVALTSCLALSACAGNAVEKYGQHDRYHIAQETPDPYEDFNRDIFEFNRTIDRYLLRPIAQGYDEVMPERGKIMVSNFVNNIEEPITFVNSVIQADAYNSFTTLWRFMLNSTFGIGGLFDVASDLGLKNRTTGFGDTLAVYGADTGVYIVLPILGPSNARDGIGWVGDVFMDPVSYTNNAFFYSIASVKTVDKRYKNLRLLDDIYATSLDPYITLRSAYIQHRKGQVRKAIRLRNESIKKVTENYNP